MECPLTRAPAPTRCTPVVGAPVVDNCVSGYNSSIFAYGQTGAGKTHTMTGKIGTGKDPRAQDEVPRGAWVCGGGR